MKGGLGGVEPWLGEWSWWGVAVTGWVVLVGWSRDCLGGLGGVEPQLGGLSWWGQAVIGVGRNWLLRLVCKNSILKATVCVFQITFKLHNKVYLYSSLMLEIYPMPFQCGSILPSVNKAGWTIPIKGFPIWANFEFWCHYMFQQLVDGINTFWNVCPIGNGHYLTNYERILMKFLGYSSAMMQGTID